jgi:amino acid transporter
MASLAQMSERRFGTFGGVFVPNVLTILGVILFLRTGWVVGSVGLMQALLILLLANSITFLTALSLSAISTNTTVGAGGAYYLISRSLGLEIGGGIGVPLYAAQAASVAFHTIGFAESVRILAPGVDARIVTGVAVLLLAVVAWRGAALAIKAQYLILAVMVVSLLGFFGALPDREWRIESWEPQLDPSFWTVFAIFFPAATGIMSGVSMSGDLRDPRRSIPRGTLGAVVATLVVYAVTMICLAATSTRQDLLDDPLIMSRLAFAPGLIFAGLWASSLSSALGHMLAAPRTLQALGRDRVVPRFFSRGSGEANEPRLALIVSVALAIGCIFIGDLDAVAPIISMFFLTTYGMVNLVAGLERLVHNPSYRPTFRVHWSLSLAGAAGCLAVMFLLDPRATAIAIALIFLIYLGLTRLRFQTQWGDMRSGFWFAATRMGLMRFTASRQHVRNWRPVVLVLSGNPENRKRLVQFAEWIEARRGLIFLGQVYAGDWDKLAARRPALQEQMEAFIAKNRLQAVAQTVIADDFEQGVVVLLQTAGLGRFQPNTILLGWSDDTTRLALYQRTVHKILALRRNLLIYRETDLPQSAMQKFIDVWWSSRETATFMLTLAHLIQTNRTWADYKIRILRRVQNEAGRAEIKAKMTAFLKEARIDAQTLVRVGTESDEEAIASASARSGIVLLGLKGSGDGESALLSGYGPMLEKLRGHAFLCRSWHELEMS